ncbi:MAG: hypothetical protein JWP63_6873 [Candidatus Solibacter sp.]|nr:hypothetical protein [Candidatus Solibacter sp.]
MAASTTLSGDIAAWFSFPDSGFSITMFGHGITIDAANIVNPGGGSQQALCTSDCEFAGWQHGNEGSSASIGIVTSASFAFDLVESGASKDFVGTLLLYQPFTTNIIASTPIETFLIAGAVTGDGILHVQTDFQFIDNRGAIDFGGGGTSTPEPNSSLVAVGLISLVPYAVLTSRRRKRDAKGARAI